MRNLQIFLLILIIIGLGLIFTRDKWVPKLVDVIISSESSNETKSSPIEITSIDIKEENFAGKKPVFSGDGVLVSESNKYIENVVAEFKKQADEDVPEMRKQFWKDNPTANYSIDITAKEVRGHLTTALVLSVYTYTGGAHGSSYYKVFNILTNTDQLISLSDAIRTDKQLEFTNLAKKELNAWRPDNTVAVFPEDVNALTFTSFKNWTLDKENLTVYFDQYEIGPGVLGAVAFPIPLSKLPDFF
jgi:hypothetical protein